MQVTNVCSKSFVDGPLVVASGLSFKRGGGQLDIPSPRE